MPLPHAMPRKAMKAARHRNIRRKGPLRIPNDLSSPIIRVRCMTMTSSAVVMLKNATANMMPMMTAALTSWALSQSKMLAYCSPTLRTVRLSPRPLSS